MICPQNYFHGTRSPCRRATSARDGCHPHDRVEVLRGLVPGDRPVDVEEGEPRDQRRTLVAVDEGMGHRDVEM
jgi:hypothetical protein